MQLAAASCAAPSTCDRITAAPHSMNAFQNVASRAFNRRIGL